MIETMEKEKVLSKNDRCDASKCPAEAYVLVSFITGELTFCGHHYSQYETTMFDLAVDIIDEREHINKKSESSA